MTFQEEHANWLASVYPNQPADLPAAGLVEEAGELMHCLVKMRQQELWGTEKRYASTDWKDKLTDAIGDCAIYACSLCNAQRWCFDSLLRDARRLFGDSKPLLKSGAALMNVAVSIVYAPEYSSNVVLYLGVLLDIAKQSSIDFDAAVVSTWNKVKQRTR